MKSGHFGPLTFQRCLMREAISSPLLHRLESCLFSQLCLYLLHPSQENRVDRTYIQGVLTENPSQGQASCGKNGSGNVAVVVVVAIVVDGINYMYPNTTRRFSAAIGYVAPFPKPWYK